MFGNLNLGDLGKMMEEAQKKAQELQSAEADRIYEARSGGGMVTAKVTGTGEVVDLEIDDSLLEDKESLQILVMMAVNEAYKQADEGKKELAAKMLGGLNPFGGN